MGSTPIPSALFCYTSSMGILDLLFPKYCVNCKKLGEYICADCFSYLSFTNSSICVACNRPSLDGLTHRPCRGRHVINGAFASINYNKITRKLLYQFKYKPFVSHLSTVLVDLFYEGIIQQEKFQEVYQSKEEKILVPIPLHSSRLRQRGYNQSELLANGLSQKLNIPMLNVLSRTKKTKAQFGLKKEERKENITGAFRISNKYQYQISNFKYSTVFLVDDILTTGITLYEAGRVLKENGAKSVFGLALARD